MAGGIWFVYLRLNAGSFADYLRLLPLALNRVWLEGAGELRRQPELLSQGSISGLEPVGQGAGLDKVTESLSHVRGIAITPLVY